MDDKKSLFLSTTFWGAILTLVPTIAAVWGYTVTAEEVASFEALIAPAIGVAGAVIAIRGRINAKKAIK